MTLESAPVPVLLEGLKLANYWNMTDLFELIQDCIIENRLVNPGNLGESESFPRIFFVAF